MKIQDISTITNVSNLVLKELITSKIQENVAIVMELVRPVVVLMITIVLLVIAIIIFSKVNVSLLVLLVLMLMKVLNLVKIVVTLVKNVLNLVLIVPNVLKDITFTKIPVLTHVLKVTMKICQPENVEPVTHPAKLVMLDKDPLPENAPSVPMTTIVNMDNTVAHPLEDVYMPKLSVTETMSTKPVTRTVTLVTLHTSSMDQFVFHLVLKEPMEMLILTPVTFVTIIVNVVLDHITTNVVDVTRDISYIMVNVLFLVQMDIMLILLLNIVNFVMVTV